MTLGVCWLGVLVAVCGCGVTWCCGLWGVWLVTVCDGWWCELVGVLGLGWVLARVGLVVWLLPGWWR